MSAEITVHKADEGASSTFKATLVDGDKVAVPSTSMITIVATLTNLDVLTAGVPTVINSRNEVDIYDTNNGSLHATSGELIWYMDPADNVIADQNRSVERHLLELKFTFGSSPVKTGRSKHLIHVHNSRNIS